MRDTSNPRLQSPPPKQQPWGFQRDGRQPSLILRPDWANYLHMPAQFDATDSAAWKGLNNGLAPPHLQHRAIEHLAFMTMFNADVFVHDPYAHAYLAGKRSIMAQVDAIIQFQPPNRSDGGEQG